MEEINFVGIIMDGNGRWAQKQGKPRVFGHKAGAKVINKIVDHAFKTGIKTLCLYAFSTENFRRPKEEVDAIFKLLKEYFTVNFADAKTSGIKVKAIGDKTALDKSLLKEIDKVEKATESNTKNNLLIAINYGGRQEIVTAVNSLLKDGLPVTEENLSKKLQTSPFGEPDLIIRTGGEKRLSNFLTYSSAYSELYFTDVLWPDFNEEEFDKAISDYKKRKRRYGGLNEKK